MPPKIIIHEKDILKELSEGATVKSIAITNKINKRSLERHIRYIREKYDCTCIAQLVTYAITNKLI